MNLEPKEKTGLKVVAIILFFGAVAVALAFLPLMGWLKDNPVKEAREQLEGGDAAQARATLEAILAVEPDNKGAARLMIESWKDVDPREELRWRSYLADHDPADLDNLRAMTQLAVGLKMYPLAEVSLETLYKQNPQVANDPEWLLAHAITMASLGKIQQAGLSAGLALKHYPENPSLQMIAALAQVQDPHSNDTQIAAAMESLTATADHPELGIHSLRGIRYGHRRLDDDAGALVISRKIVTLDQAELADWLIHADLVLGVEPGGIALVWPKLSEYALADIAAFSMILTWLQDNDRLDLWESWLEYLEWEGLPTERKRIIQTLILNKRGDWQGLLDLAQEQDWGKADYLRELMMARALRAQNRSWQASWRNALDLAREDPEAARLIAATIASWDEWDDEYLALLETIKRRHISLLKWSLQKLFAYHIQHKNTLDLYHLSQELNQIDPDDLLVLNNLNYFRMLLGIDRENSMARAKKLYREHPNNRAMLGAYVLAECLDAQPDAALDVLEALPVSVRESPGLLHFYVLALCKAGRVQEVGILAKKINKSDLLPEEHSLLSQCLSTLNR